MNQEKASRLKISTTEQGILFDEARKDPRGPVPPKLTALRFRLGQKAKQEPKFRFYSLYGHLQRMDVLETAFATVADKDGSETPGVDGITIDQIVGAEGGAAAFLSAIQEELRAKRYCPQPVKRVYIPKANGKLRPLGIPTIRDRRGTTHRSRHHIPSRAQGRSPKPVRGVRHVVHDAPPTPELGGVFVDNARTFSTRARSVGGSFPPSSNILAFCAASSALPVRCAAIISSSRARHK